MNNQANNFMVRWYDELWNNENESTIHEMLHPGAKAFGLGAELVVGPDEFKIFYREFKSAYFNIKVTVDKTFSNGSYEIALCTVNAVHNETGKPVCFTGTSIAEVENGRMIKAWNHFDFLGLNIQTGKIKPEWLV